MLFDLNIPWSPSLDPAELQRTISFASSLGYDTIALNHSVKTITSPIINPIPCPVPFSVPSSISILRRCTVYVEDPSNNYRLPNIAAAYDILALRPTSQKGYEAACLFLSEQSIISLDLTQRFPFHFRPKPLMTAINRGCKIELCYSQAVMGDANKRRYFISNAMAILRATKGRGLLISSEATGALGVRAPADVVNLFAVWGLGRERGMEAISINARGVVVNEGLKRSSFRGVVDVIDGGQRTAAHAEAIATAKNDKRRAEAIEGDKTPQLSRRAQKRARLAAREAEQAEGSGTSTPKSDLKSSTAQTPLAEYTIEISNSTKSSS
ncbi:RNase P subunit p30-domain-containing protein [Bisporella sp. PMI_857]|nr:RNase P subunit p30-domain-containing protein [Bisporella sp. PMI_857]